MKKMKFGLLPRVIIAIVLGVLLGNVLNESIVRVFVTFNSLFSQFLGFVIPLIIIGLVTPAIADIGSNAGKMLLATVGIAYADTVLTGVLSYGVGSTFFPDMISSVSNVGQVVKPESTAPYFEIAIPPMADVMSALVFSFLVGVCIAYSNTPVLKSAFKEFETIITKTIAKAIVPLLPLFIFGIFLDMTMKGDAMRIMVVFAKIIIVIFILHIVVLLYQFVVAGVVAKRNPLKLLGKMMPAYFTALGTSSSAATIPVTLGQTEKNGVSQGVAAFVVPLCATIHMSGSTLKITACALTICMLDGIPHTFPIFFNFILLLAIVMVAAPGVPGGAIMAALAPLASVLGFTAGQQALMIALYIAMDSFGTACNVTGDGAIAIIIDEFFKKKPESVPVSTDGVNPQKLTNQ